MTALQPISGSARGAATLGQAEARRPGVEPVAGSRRYPHAMPGGRRQGRGRAKRPSRSERHQRARAAGVNAAVKRAEGAIEITLPQRRVEPESRRRAPRADELGQDLPRARGAEGARPRRLRRAAAHARPGGAPPALRRARRGRGRPRHRRGARQRRARRSSAARSRWRRAPARCSCSTRCSGRTIPSAARPGRGSCSRATTATSSCSARSTPSRSSCTRSRRPRSRSSSACCRSSSSASGRCAALTPGTVVVAFSRKAVLALAGEINRLHPDRVSVLYGAMPLTSRREEIDRFLGGTSDVTVATDVLGHGVNLPCETLLFAETTKFDGESRRDLLPWELAQIAGRAGRFGLVERGHVGVLDGRAVGERRSGDRRGGAAAARRASRPGTSATASSTRRGSGRGSPTSASTTRGASTPRSPPGIASRRARGRTRAGSRSSR